MSSRQNTGLFITFEGIEGSGKSSQQKLLGEYLVGLGFDVILTREPGGTPVGDGIRELLLDPDNEISAETEALLYAASRAEHVSELIRPSVEAGKVVLCDRYLDSSVAYQVFGRGLPMDMVLQINRWAIQGIEPELTFLLMLPIEEGLARATKRAADRIERENIDFHRRVGEGYLELARKEQERIRVIDGTRSKDEIHEEIKRIVNDKVLRERR